ncbi:MAG: peroxiredoxin Q/BCP [Halocynthiibacter sp.]|jgi:peroxiredoxin Q/BCP
MSTPAPLIEPGQPAPDFTLPRDMASGGGAISLSDLRGQNVVLYFYPKDDTSGCTTQALDFTSLLPDFAKANTVILGLSKDPIAKHDKFVAKHGLGIPLLSDFESDTCERYGTWGDKQMYGKVFQGIIRTTVLIGADGIIRKVWPKVRVKGHVAAVLDEVRAL